MEALIFFICLVFYPLLSHSQVHYPIKISRIKNTFVVDSRERAIFSNNAGQIKLIYSVFPDTKIFSMLNGKVVSIAKNSRFGSFDIQILCSDSLLLEYSNIDKPKVKKNQSVNLGQIIGCCSSSDKNTDLYIWATKKNKPIDLLRVYNLPVKRNKY
jgi:hypothetical protein